MVWANAPPPPLAMPSPRRPSGSASPSSSRSSSPVLSGLDSSSALILVHDSEDSNTPFNFSSDDEDDDDHSPQFEIRRASIPPLGPSVVFLYLLAPYLKLGAMLLPNTEISLKYGLPQLLVFAGMSVFARQVLYLLARYMRTADLEDVILDAFARGRGNERRRGVLRSIIRAGTGGLRILLATIYLRESSNVLLPLLPSPSSSISRPLLIIGLSIILLPFSFAQSLASKRVVYVTWLSVASFIAWLGCVSHAYSQGNLQAKSGWLRMGTLWQGTTLTAFAFTSSPTLSLYASLKGSTPPVSTAKASRTRSFKHLSALSVAIAICLTLPLVFFSAKPNKPATLSSSASPKSASIAIPILNAVTLLFGIPTLIITTPSLPIPERVRHRTTIQISKTLINILYVVLALLPTQLYGTLNDILLVSALASTYFLPAFIHVTAHFFKRPLAIVMPQIPGTPHTISSTRDGPSSPRAGPDELLLRKERALQRKQFRKRIVWDVGVWVLLVGSAAGTAWAVGRLAQKW